MWELSHIQHQLGSWSLHFSGYVIGLKAFRILRRERKGPAALQTFRTEPSALRTCWHRAEVMGAVYGTER